MPCVSVRHIRAGKASYKAYKSSKKTAKKASKSRAKPQYISGACMQSSAPARHAHTHATKIVETSIKIPHDPKYLHQTAFYANETLRSKSKKTSPKPKTTPHVKPDQPLEGFEPYLARDPAEVIRAFHASKRLTRADLINAESCLGSILFGPVPAGHRREFFHDRENVWIWHEGWYDQNAHHRQQTIRYEVRASGVYKKISAGNYRKLEGIELENFRQATHAYLKIIKTYLYNHPHSAVQS